MTNVIIVIHTTMPIAQPAINAPLEEEWLSSLYVSSISVLVADGVTVAVVVAGTIAVIEEDIGDG